MGITMEMVLRNAKKHSGTIAAVAGVVGLAATAFLSGKAAVRAHEEIDPNMDTKEKAKLYFKIYWKTGVSFIVTTGCILGSDRIHVKKELGLAAVAIANKDKLVEATKKVREKFGEEAYEEFKREMASDETKKAAEWLSDINLAQDEFLVYVPDAEEFYVTTDKRMNNALYKTNRELNIVHDARLSYFCSMLGRRVGPGLPNPLLSDIGWRWDNVDQCEQWQLQGGHWIDFVNDIYVRELTLPNGKVTLDNYTCIGEARKPGDIPALFFTVDPDYQRLSNRL